MNARDEAGAPDRGASRAPAAGSAPPPSIRVVRNARPGVDWNTCGQAAVATVLAHYRLGPFAPGTEQPDDAAAIDFVRAAFPPDLPFGLGTSAFRMAAALRAHGLDVEHIHSGWFGRGLGRAMERVRTHAAPGRPVPVCLDDGMLGGSPHAAHWAIVTRVDQDGVWLGNAGLPGPLALATFVAAWRCRWLPWSHNHAAVIALRR